MPSVRRLNSRVGAEGENKMVVEKETGREEEGWGGVRQRKMER